MIRKIILIAIYLFELVIEGFTPDKSKPPANPPKCPKKSMLTATSVNNKRKAKISTTSRINLNLNIKPIMLRLDQLIKRYPIVKPIIP